MAETAIITTAGRPAPVDWRAIWSGAFVFYAIWAVFGALGLAIFASAANPAATSARGQDVGMAIWAIILSIIAMYVAGRETGRLASVATRHDGLVHGLIMFGLAIVGAMVLVSIGGAAIVEGNSTATAVPRSYALSVLSGLGWAGFLALFLGWLAAMWGASSGVVHKRPAELETMPRSVRPAA